MRTRRTTELTLLLAAAPLIVVIFALVHGAERRTLEATDFAVAAGLIVAFVVAHVAIRRLSPDADPVLLPLTAVLSGTGLAFVTRLDPELAASQVIWILVGVAAMIATLASVRSLERLARYKYTIMLAALVLLVLPALVGVEINGAKLWIRVAGLSFQPGEIAKVLVVVFLAAYLAENREVLSVSTSRRLGVWLPNLRRLGPLLFMWLVSLFIMIAERDLGSSLLFFGIFLVMIYTATGRPTYVLVGLGLFAIGAAIAHEVFSHVQTRVAIWIDPFADAAGRGYQLVQSLFAFSAGGMAGVGVGRGLPGRIPFVETDFIFAVIGEELGLLGAVGFIVAYLLFCMRGLATAARARSDVAAFTAVGLVAAFGLQTFVIIGGVTRLIPLTGITLPFVSYGGSSILANFILLGLLLRAGDAATGRGSEMQSTSADLGVLGRFALSRRLVRVSAALAALMVLLAANLTWIQVVRAAALRTHPANTRGLAAELRQPRGSILTADGVVLARSDRDSSGVYRRSYPQGPLAAHVLGYYSSTYGRAGIEQAANEALSGQRAFRDFRDVIESAAGLPVPGSDVVLTIDSDIQRAAASALGDRRGAVVAIEPATGKVLALTSAPTYDPGSIDERWDSLSAQGEAAPLLDRSMRSLYPPGSTFKVVTTTAAIEQGVAGPQTTYQGPARLEIGGAPVTNYGGSSYGTVTLERALASSINTVFGQLAVDIGARGLVSASESFGFGLRPPIELPSLASLMPDPAEMTTWETAWAGVGQPVGEHESPPGPQATVLQMALVASGVANSGDVMSPYLIDRITDDAGRTLSATTPRRWRRAATPATAATVSEMMVEAVRAGSGTRAQIAGVQVAGKTGTAEVGSGLPTHAWFIGFAPANDPRIAVAVVVESSGTGGTVAAPVARQVMEAGLARP